MTLDDICLKCPHVFELICEHLDYETLKNFRLVNKIWYFTVGNGKTFWKRIIEHRILNYYHLDKYGLTFHRKQCWKIILEKAPRKVIKELANSLPPIHKHWLETRHPLQFAAYNGLVDSCQFIIQNSLDQNTTDRSGETALHIAARKCHYEICTLIVNRYLTKI